MKKIVFPCLAMMVVSGSTLFAQADTDPRVQTDPTGRVNASALDTKTSGSNIRASQLVGMNIQNMEGKSVGEIQDLVIDATSGKIRYAAVTYGGFLGIGDKLFAVPFAAFNCTTNPKNSNEHVLMLDVTQKQLEGAVGFDQDHWPNFADEAFVRELDRRYNVKDRVVLPGGRVEVDVNRGGVDVNVDRDRVRK